MPWASEGVGVAFGVEYRKESLELLPDVAFQLLPSSDLAGQGAPTLAGQRRVRRSRSLRRGRVSRSSRTASSTISSLEARLSLLRLYDPGSRRQRFSTDTYKIGLDFAPIRDIRFRAAYNRAVRAPNIQELFAPQRVVLNGTGDPCAGADS